MRIGGDFNLGGRMKKNIILVLLMVFVTPFSSGVSLAILTPVADGHHYYTEECCESWHYLPFCISCSSYIDNGIEISNGPFESDENCPYGYVGHCGYSMRKTGIIEFNILSKKGLFSRGEMKALLSLKVKAGDLTSYSCLRVYNMQDVNENGEITVKDKAVGELIGEICKNLLRGNIITLDVTSALEHDLFDPDQTAFSGFVIHEVFYGYDSIEFYDHKNFVHAPRLSISPPLCPVTAIYGTDSTETEFLRSIRDNILSKTSEGQALIDLYYQWSPIIVRAMEADEGFKQEVKDIVDEVLLLIE